VGPLGSGGTAQVYRAKDVRLHREVAFKILTTDFAKDPHYQKRFMREARAASSLNHPNILAVYDVGNQNGTSYIVSELVEGESLRKVVAKGPVPVRKLIDIAIQIADGLAAAHQAGLVHRDLKPENVMITRDGRVKILDFGLAKVVFSNDAGSQEETESAITKGTIIGTALYMSPEQASGEPVDFRSDHFSFGVMLYEMLTGKRIFHRNTPIRTIAAIVRDDPPPIDSLNPSVPQNLSALIHRCLQKEPDQRYGATIDLVYELRNIKDQLSQTTVQIVKPRQKQKYFAVLISAILIAAFTIAFFNFDKLKNYFGAKHDIEKIDSLALMPLMNLSGDAKQEYFADGMTEELISKLARIESLRIISRSSVMAYKGKQKSPREVAKELEVDAIVEGSVMQVGDRVRITAQLVDPATASNLWADSYEGDVRDVFALQNKVALAIANEIQIRLKPNEQRHLHQSPTVIPEAYEAYLRAENLKSPDLSKQDAELMVEMLERAVKLDPKFALAYVRLSRTHSLWGRYDWEDAEEHRAKARLAVDRAFEIQPDLPEGHVALGFYYLHALDDRKAAAREFNIAAKDLPNDSELLLGLAFVERKEGKFKDALETMQRILAMNPRDVPLMIQIGAICEQIRKYVEADQYFTRAISLQPDALYPYIRRAKNLRWNVDELAKSRSVLESIPKRHEGSLLWCWHWYSQEIFERNYPAALKRIIPMQDKALKGILAGLAYRFSNQPIESRRAFEGALSSLETKLKINFNDAYAHADLALVYGGIGKKNQGIEEAKLAIKLMPASHEAFEGPHFIENLAEVYVLVGEYDSALTQIEYLFTIESGYWLSHTSLKMDPIWDPLRTNPRYQKLIQQSK
jgi:TolB-like protein/tetratricopeptide (TPR) repeat protein